MHATAALPLKLEFHGTDTDTDTDTDIRDAPHVKMAADQWRRAHC